jgi:hypothetical protein
MAWNTVPTFTVGQKLAAGDANKIGGDLNAIGAAWTAYTPAWGSTGTAPAIGNGTITGSYVAAGKLIIAKITMVTGSTSTYGTGTYTWSLPFTATTTGAAAGLQTGVGAVFDTSAGSRFVRTVWQASSGAIELLDANSATVGQTVPMTWATGDSMSATFTYEAA